MGRARLQFLKSYLSEPGSVGALAPSSRHLARRMVSGFDLEAAQVVAELGPGTGAFTGTILSALGTQTQFLAIEREESFVRHLQQEYPRASIIHDSAENLRGILNERDLEYADVVISGLPWAAFPEDLQLRLLQAVHDSLPAGGQFATFAYIGAASLPRGRRFRRLLEGRFANVRKTPVVWRNLPPAFVYVAER